MVCMYVCICTRASTRVLARIISAKVRLYSYPPAHPAAASCRAILAYDIKNTSLQHVDQILALAGPATV